MSRIGYRLFSIFFTPFTFVIGRGGAELARVSHDGVCDTSWAIAPRNARSSRAMATTTWGAFCPRALSGLSPLHKRLWAFQRRAWIGLATFARRRGRCRLTCAGLQEAQVPVTRARRAWRLPVFVKPPWRR